MKKGEDSQFLYDTHVEASVDDVVRDIAVIYNGRLKISRICYGKICYVLFFFTKIDYSEYYGAGLNIFYFDYFERP